MKKFLHRLFLIIFVICVFSSPITLFLYIRATERIYKINESTKTFNNQIKMLQIDINNIKADIEKCQ